MNSSEQKISGEEIEQLLKEMTKVRPELLDKNALKLYNTIMKILDKNDQLESNNQKLIEKLEKRRKQNNKRYGTSIDNDDIEEMYEYSGKVEEDDYILEILKGEKE